MKYHSDINNVSKIRKHVYCGFPGDTFISFYRGLLTCAGFSHFLRKSSLALARNSFTVKDKNTTEYFKLALCLDTF